MVKREDEDDDDENDLRRFRPVSEEEWRPFIRAVAKEVLRLFGVARPARAVRMVRNGTFFLMGYAVGKAWIDPMAVIKLIKMFFGQG
jgi:hypothetical protein